MTTTPCPRCQSDRVHDRRPLEPELACPACGRAWSNDAATQPADEDLTAVREGLIYLASDDDGNVTYVCLDALSAADVQVDRDSGTIKNVSVISKGPALGHGFEIDDTTSNPCPSVGRELVVFRGKPQGTGQREPARCRERHPVITVEMR
jgi:uncharacterized Zn ribbon protein